MNLIEFSCHADLLHLKNIHPIPSKLDIPEWYKKIEKQLDEDPRSQSVKSCMPFLDSMTCGYLLPLSQDMILQHNIWVKNKNKYMTHIGFSNNNDKHKIKNQYNLNIDTEEHPTRQVGGKDSFMGKKNKGMGIPKIMNPWTIKTPPGYSCLFVPPMQREMDYIHIIPGIVDTDTFDLKINFPFIINTEKYDKIDTIISMGTPYVQVIPFKREGWKMNTCEHKKSLVKELLHNLKIKDIYKIFSWNKKIYK